MRLCFTFQTILIRREVRRTAHKKRVKKSDQTKCSQLHRETVKVVSTDVVCRVIKACHDDPVWGEHFGRDKTYQKVAKRHYWSGVKNDIAVYVSKWDSCQRQSNKVTPKMPSLHPEAVPLGCWHQVGMGLVGPLPETERGHEYIFFIFRTIAASGQQQCHSR